MKIIIEHEDKDNEEFEDVIEFALTGIQGKGQINDFYSYSGRFQHLMEKTHSLYIKLKDLFLREE